ncbi:hypothetical protein ACFY00_30765 [Kitasatospora sp. NPDC001540]|uniref:hypothetical protein n=1 Tax=Kitasatospora sp. NPDC001540 TaxID=3364014 RepID=UPI00369C9593
MTIREVTGDDDALFRWYDRESQPQSAFVELELDSGTLLADYDGIIGNGMPSRVYHRIDVRFPLGQILTPKGANDLLAELAPLAQRVLDGSEVEWDGSNHVGRILTEDAQAAHDEIEKRCAEVSEWDGGVLQVYSVDTIGDLWSAEDAGVTAQSTDEELEAIVKRLEQEVAEGAGNSAVVHGLGGYLKELRRELQEDQDED